MAAEFVNGILPGIAIIGGVLAMLISAICWNIRRSRCTRISGCGMRCEREVMTLSEMAADQLNVPAVPLGGSVAATALQRSPQQFQKSIQHPRHQRVASSALSLPDLHTHSHQSLDEFFEHSRGAA